MKSTSIYLDKLDYSTKEENIFQSSDFKITFFKYDSGIDAIKLYAKNFSFVILPFMGHQIWSYEYQGEIISQKSIFDSPLNTKKFGDTYGAFLIHCGLININGPSESEDYPIHGELPFANFKNNRIEIGEDENGEYIGITGIYEYKNSQDYYWEYIPMLKIRKNSDVLEMEIKINNKRYDELNYVFMCHMNWLGVDKSRLVYSAKKDYENFRIQDLPLIATSERERNLLNFVESIKEDPFKLDIVDFENQIFAPELCVNIKYEKDSKGFAHSMQILPDGKAYYVSFDATKLPFGLRWYCKSNEENGLGFCLPTTGSNESTKHQYEKGYFNTIPSYSSDSFKFKFGVLQENEAKNIEEKIKKIIKEE